ncbi:hypothetical protein KPH14_000762 [Odynerus spinipes]|uniref:Uncharacterized protein n=1 Tax=Odynerus spinipes TaxID=1348599 RepID=A0AAD9RE55_9HYME|nr:hypothetical protein KPH14_000762 [Odynerus spinipes]
MLTQSMNVKDEDMTRIPYQEAVGSLLYLSQVSRPDIAFAVNQGTLDYKLTYSKKLTSDIVGYGDADWANDPKERKSVTGFVFLASGGAISWASQRQRTVALSTVEAEYIALSSTCQEALWLQQLSGEIEPESAKKAVQIYSDNNGGVLESAP